MLAIFLRRLRLVQKSLAAQDGGTGRQRHKTLRLWHRLRGTRCARASLSLSLCTCWRGVDCEGPPCGNARLGSPIGGAVAAEPRANYGRPWGCATVVEQWNPSLATFMVVPCVLGKMGQSSAALIGCAIDAGSRVSYGRPWGRATVAEERNPSLAAFMVVPSMLENESIFGRLMWQCRSLVSVLWPWAAFLRHGR